MRGFWTIVAAVVLGPGCLDVGAFACGDDSQCDVANGVCVDGYCAVPDPSCDNQHRWVDRAPPEKAGKCTGPLDDGTTSTTSVSETLSTSGTTSTTDSTTIDPSLGESSTTAIHDSTGMQCKGNRCACAADLAVGGRHSCATRTDGQAVCWGFNGYEQITIEKKDNEIQWPTEVGLSPSDVALSDRHSCAIQDGAVWCWGRNAEGQSAYTSSDLTVAPTSDNGVADPALLETGSDFTCALSNGADVTCWGENVRHQLGTEGMTRYHTRTLAFTPIGLAAGEDHVCAWTAGQLWCWGDNRTGQLGVDPMMLNRDDVPHLVIETAGIMAVAIGDDHTCAAVHDGTEVWCIGASDVGQLGVVLPAPEPWTWQVMQVPDLPPGEVVAELHARVDHTCARFENDDIWCWGGLVGMVLGTGMPNDQPLLPPARVGAREDFDEETILRIGVGSQHICARTDEMRVWCWGSDSNEQIGPIDPEPGNSAVELDLDCPL